MHGSRAMLRLLGPLLAFGIWLVPIVMNHMITLQRLEFYVFLVVREYMLSLGVFCFLLVVVGSLCSLF